METAQLRRFEEAPNDWRVDATTDSGTNPKKFRRRRKLRRTARQRASRIQAIMHRPLATARGLLSRASHDAMSFVPHLRMADHIHLAGGGAEPSALLGFHGRIPPKRAVQSTPHASAPAAAANY
jgi:hypothetical protein